MSRNEDITLCALELLLFGNFRPEKRAELGPQVKSCEQDTLRNLVNQRMVMTPGECKEWEEAEKKVIKGQIYGAKKA